MILQTAGNQVTIPVSLVVGANVFEQANPLNFTMVYGGASPLPQVITMASTGTNFNILAAPVVSTGGGKFALRSRPAPMATVYRLRWPLPWASIRPPNLAAGTYSAQIIVQQAGGAQALTVPVTLTVEPPTATFFDSLAGQLTFSIGDQWNRASASAAGDQKRRSRFACLDRIAEHR